MVENPAKDTKMRAIEMLNHFINKRSQSQAHPKSATTPSRNTRLLPPNDDESSNETNNVSPTPKRRKLTQSSPVRKTEEPIRLSMEVHLSQPQTTLEKSRTDLSPGGKSVAFSDQLDSSPAHQVMNSSPRHTPGSVPSKSILRNPMGTQTMTSLESRYEGGSNLKVTDRGRQHEVTSAPSDPKSLDFWQFGEVHIMRNPSDLKEFKSIIEGGLDVLAKNDNKHMARRFEVYASINSIIPASSIKSTLELNNKKYDVLIENLKKIVDTCLPQLRGEQQKLLGAGKRKNPFGSRLYIQIVRLFGSLLAEHRIIRALTKMPVLRDKLREVFDLSKEALTHPNANKVIIGAQYSLQAYEKYGSYFLQKDDILSIIRSVIKAKDIQSTNLICEKLHLMRKFITKYTNVMLEIIPEWLPGEVFGKILLDDEALSLNILYAGTAVVLDLLKKTLDSSFTREAVILCMRDSLAKDILATEHQQKSVHADSQKSGPLTLEELLQRHITFLIIGKKEVKPAMDLWLATIGLIYNSTEGLVELSKSDSHGWLRLNRICFLSGCSSSKFIALKAWRIILYYCWNNVKGKSLHDDHTLILLLKRPFEFSSTTHSDFEVNDGLIYYLTGIMFLLSVDSKSHERNNHFRFFWQNLVSPIYLDHILNSENKDFITRALQLLSVLLSDNHETSTERNTHRNIFPLKVIASAGVKTSEITPLAADVVDSVYESIWEVVRKSLSIDSLDFSVKSDLFKTLVTQMPPRYIFASHFSSVLELLTLLSEGIRSTKDPFETLSPLLLSVAKPFAHCIFKDTGNLRMLLTTVERLTKNDSTANLKVMKLLCKAFKRRISEITIIESFLNLEDQFCNAYASNWIGTVLLPSSLSVSDIKSFVDIVRRLRSPLAIESLLSFCAKSREVFDVCEMLDIETWSDKDVAVFVTTFVAKNSNRLSPTLENKLKNILPLRDQLFNELFAVLREIGCDELLMSVIISNPEVVSNLVSTGESSILTLFPSNLPKATVSHFVSHCPEWPEELQNAFINWVLDVDQVSTLFVNSHAFISFILGSKTGGRLSINRINLISRIVQQLYFKQLWESLSYLLIKCLESPLSSPILLAIDNSETMFESFNPSGTGDEPEDSSLWHILLIKSMGHVYLDSEVAAALELTESLLDSEKFQSLSFCRDEFKTFFIDRASSFAESERDNSLKVFHTFAQKLMGTFDEIHLSTLISILSHITSIVTAHSLEVLTILYQAAKNGKGFLQYFEDYKVLLEEAGTTEFKKETSTASESITKELKGPSGHSIVGGNENLTVKSQNELSVESQKIPSIEINKTAVAYLIQVPATQETLPTTSSPEVRNTQGEVSIVTSAITHESPTNIVTTGLVKDNKEVQRTPHESKPFHGSPSTSAQEIVSHAQLESQEPVSISRNYSKQSEQQQTVHIGEKRTFARDTNDDFAPVETEQDDEFLSKMEQSLEAADKNVVSQSNQEPNLPVELKRAHDDEDDSAASKLRIPIFNSSKFYKSQAGTADKERNSASLPLDPAEVSHNESEKKNEVDVEKIEGVENSDDLLSRDMTPSLKVHFPSKKARKLVSRLRAFSVADLTHLSAEEKRNLRIELLDFLMSLEHEKEFYQ